MLTANYEQFTLNKIVNKLSSQFETKLTPVAEYVFCGIHRKYGRVAVKWANKYKQRAFLIQEAMFLKENDIKNTPAFHDFIKMDNFYFLIMSWIYGVQLSSAHQNKEKSLQWLDDIKDILSSLHHQKINHGDIKPSNIIINNNIGYLIDFGSICQHGNAYQYMDRYSFSPRYAAYNPLAKVGRVSAADDHYSLAISVLEYLGEHRFKGSTLLEEITNNPTVPFQKNNVSDNILTPLYLLVNAEIVKAHQHNSRHY